MSDNSLKVNVLGKLVVNPLLRLNRRPDIITLLCEKDGNFIKYAEGDACIDKNEELQMSTRAIENIIDCGLVEYLQILKDKLESFINYKGELRGVYGSKFLPFSLMRNQAFVNWLCKEDGKFLRYVNERCITQELLSLSINNADPDKRFVLPEDFTTRKYDNLKSSPIFMKWACSVDGTLLEYANREAINDENVLIAFSNEQKPFIPTGTTLERINFKPNILNMILSREKEKPYSLEQLTKMINFTIDENIINTPFFKHITERICKEYEVDIKIFNNIMRDALTTDDEILKTLDIRLLNAKYFPLYTDLKDKFYILASHPDIQTKIFDIGEDELGSLKIKLFSLLLDRATTTSNQEKITDWENYFLKIVNSFIANKELYNDLVKNIDLLKEEDFKNIVDYALGKHRFKINSLEDIHDYEKIRENFINSVLNDDNSTIDDVRDAVLEKAFGISYKVALELYNPFHRGIFEDEEKFDSNLVLFFKQLQSVIKEENIELLKESVKNTETKHLDFEEPIKLKSIIKKHLIASYNSSFFKTTNKSSDDFLEGSSIYFAAGRDGTRPFQLCYHALGAYSEYRPNTENFNYRENWLRPKMTNHGICTSFVGNNNLGTAQVRYACLGFTDLDDRALLLEGPKDLGSDNREFATSERDAESSDYFYGKRILDWTRYRYNEVVIERMVGNHKRMPSYIILECDDYDRLVKEYLDNCDRGRYDDPKNMLFSEMLDCDLLFHSLKAAREFGGERPLPIVVIEREKIAKSERDNIEVSLNCFLEQDSFDQKEIEKYYHDIIVEFNNNYASHQKNYKLQEKYFSQIDMTEILGRMKRKIISVQRKDEKMGLMMIASLKKTLLKEEEKQYLADNHFFDFDRMIDFCNSELNRYRSKNKGPKYISSLFDGTIKDDNFTTEYDTFLKKELKDQLEVSQIKRVMGSELTRLVSEKIGLIDEKSLYSNRDSSIHSRKHIEDVVLFASLIGKDIGLSKEDMDLLLTSAVYHDAGRVNDQATKHAKASSLLAGEQLREKYSETQLQMIRAAIEYHEEIEYRNENGEIVLDNFQTICQNLGIDTSNEELLNRTKKIAFCLKDADALDRTRFSVERAAFLNTSFLHFPISSRLVKLGEQLNEYYAINDIVDLEQKNPGLKQHFDSKIALYGSPKEALQEYRDEIIEINEKSEDTYGKK